MLVKDYDAFVMGTDLSREKSRDDREDIGVYGLVGEMGALTNAVKRRLIAEAHGQPWDIATDEIKEELGDSLWYWSLLAQIYASSSEEILKGDLSNLVSHLAASDEKGELFRQAIGKEGLSNFRREAELLVAKQSLDIDAYQQAAILTRRTTGKMFVGVCLTVLAQLGAEMLRARFPSVEQQLNTVIPNRDPRTILGEVAWHLSAIATAYKLKLSEVAEINQEKLNRRLNKIKSTPLHDDKYPSHEQFPRKFDVSFVMVGPRKSRMYLSGRQLGDELTDNAYEDDGYRFHDVMHLAVVSNLGWSPVLRSLLKLKRKSNKKTDEVEDGARARIVEEAVIKAIHSEGERVSQVRKAIAGGEPVPLFASHSEITFKLLNFIDDLTEGLEVSQNQYWEWESAILQGNEVFCDLRREQQGTVNVDLVERRITYRPEVYVDCQGTVASMGAATIRISELASADESEQFVLNATEKEDLKAGGADATEFAKWTAAKKAMLLALDIKLERSGFAHLSIKRFGSGFSVKATESVRSAMWERKVISFRTTFVEDGGAIQCLALALADPNDAVKKDN